MYRAHSNLPIAAILGFVCVIFLYPYSHAKSITIPGDANSIQEAVDLAVSGDEILLATDFVEWNPVVVQNDFGEYIRQEGVVITDKNIVIRSKLENTLTAIGRKNDFGITRKDNSTLHIVNSNITIQNCDLIPIISNDTNIGLAFPVFSPIIIESGLLLLENCNYISQIISNDQLIIKDCKIENSAFINTPRYLSHKGDFPTIEIKNTVSSSLQIMNSTITSDNSSSINNIHILDSSNANIRIVNSNLFGGTSYYSGTESLLIDNCNNFSLFISGSTFSGNHADEIRPQRGGGFQYGGRGGNGLTISNSNGALRIGDTFNILEGNKGANGILEYDSTDWELKTINGASGGHGLSIINSTIKVNVSNFEDELIASGGKGGEGAERDGIVAFPGKDGLPIFIDENSTIIYETSIDNWMVH